MECGVCQLNCSVSAISVIAGVGCAYVAGMTIPFPQSDVHVYEKKQG